MENFLKVKEVAQRLRVSPMTIHRLINKGDLRAIRVGSAWRIPTVAFEEYLNREL